MAPLPPAPSSGPTAPGGADGPADGRTARPPRAVVVGAGIGGLAAAAALHRGGWRVTVLERAPRIEAVGAGLGVTPNGQRALDLLGLGDAVRALRGWSGGAGLRTPSGRWLMRTGDEAAAERFGGPVVPLHRAVLVDLLRSRLPAAAVRTGSAAALLDDGSAGGPARVRGGGREWEAELVVAADGVHSAARAALFPAAPGPRYAGFTAWRLVVPRPAGEVPPHETWGRGAIWGTQPLHDGRVYAYATAAVPPGGRAPDGEAAELRRRFGDWHQPIPALLDAAAHGEVLRNDVHEAVRPLPAFHRGRVVLLGDAAHAMAPTLGQGGNLAIEDAVVLAHHARPGADLTGERGGRGALAAYTADRLPRTADVVRRAARAGTVITLTSAPACALRAAAMRLAGALGPGLALRALDGVADWSPPGHPYAAGAPGRGAGSTRTAPRPRAKERARREDRHDRPR